jgi:pyochelin synthetase
MTLNKLMTQLTLLKIAVRVNGDGQLSISAPKGALTDELKFELQRFKQEMIGLLKKGRQNVFEQVEFAENEADRYEPFPFSDLQMAFYMANDPYMEFNVRPHYYCESDIASLDIGRYENALNKAISRHKGEIVLLADEQRLVALKEVAPVICKVNDFRNLPLPDVKANLLNLRNCLKREQLPLDRWPWFDFQISRWIELGQEVCRIHMNHNNFYTDGFGAMVLQRDIDHFYENPMSELPPIQLTYRDAVLGLERLAESPSGLRAKAYWRDRLENLPEPPQLPLVPGVDRRRRSALQRRENYLTEKEWTDFKAYAGQAGLTPTSAIIAAYSEILSVWSGSRHFILSNMVTRRLPLHADIGKIIGNFASLYPLEVDFRDTLPFNQKAIQLQAQILSDSDHREWGGMQVMQALNRQRGELGSVPCPYVVGSGLFVDGFSKPDFSCLETAQTMLDHQFWELDDGRYYYVWDLLEEYFPAGLIDQMWDAFHLLLKLLSKNYSNWELSVLDVAKKPESRHIIPPLADVSKSHLLHDGLGIVGTEIPDRTLLDMSSGRTSYREVDIGSSVVARLLADFGIQRNELVAVIMDRSAELLIATLGILKAGGAYVPIDSSLPAERIQYMLMDSRVRVVLTSTSCSSMLSAFKEVNGGLQIVVVDEVAKPEAQPIAGGRGLGQQKCAESVQETDLAYVIYTSGSTGNPKGVMIEHCAALNTIADINGRFGVNSSDKIFGVSSFSFDLSVYDLFGAIDAGASVVYPDPDGVLNPAHWLELLVSKKVTIWNSAPPLMSLLVETALRQKASLPDLRLVMLSGDWIPVELPSAVKRIAPNAVVVSLGGATEASIWSIFYTIDKVRPEWSSIPYGFPLSNQKWYVRDYMGRSTPVWTQGELFIGGRGLARGYWADENKTRCAFIVDQQTGERLYRTGDIGRYVPDGSIEFLGRIDAQIKIQGHRIELGEIEFALNSSHLVKDVVVLAKADEIRSLKASAEIRPSRAKTIVAYITLTKEANTARLEHASLIDELKKTLQKKLPQYMIPSGWLVLPTLPITSNGKIDRVALSKLDIQNQSTTDQSTPCVLPRNEIENALAAIWKTILARESISVHDDFFNVGGQSFDAVRLIAQIKEKFGKSLMLSDVWQERTIDKLALHLQKAESSFIGTRLVPVNLEKEGRPYFFVHPGGGQILCYYDLAARLNRPSYAFLALSDDVDQGKLSSVESMAARYLDQLKAIQPAGPYSIAGWSSGGCVAFEIAKQLEELGERVEQLILIDCPSPIVHTPVSRAAMLHNFFEDLDVKFPPDILRSTDPTDIFNENQFNAAVDLFNLTSSILLDSAHLFQVFRVFTAIVDAGREYRASRQVSCDILLLRASDGHVSEFMSHPHTLREDWGWGLMTTGEIFCKEISGTHYTLLKTPNVEPVAAAIIGIE